MTPPVSSLTVLLTSRCNLACGYCYRDAGAGRSPAWPELRAGLDWAVRRAGPHLEIVLSGGEPLLEPGLLGRALDHLAEVEPRRTSCNVRLLTNGTLLTDDWLDRLAGCGVRIQLSHDGTPVAQAFRGDAAAATGDDLLRRVRERLPRLWAEGFTVAVTVHPGNAGELAASVHRLLELDVRDILIAPALGPFPAADGAEDVLRAQFTEIAALSRAHHARTGRVPVRLLRRRDPPLPRPQPADRVCNAVTGEAPALGVDGVLAACVLFAEGGGGLPDHLPAARRERLLAALRWGRPDDPDLARRRAESGAALRREASFTGRLRKHAGDLACAGCSELETCQICPYGDLWLEGDDPDRTADLPCLVTRCAAAARATLPVLPAPPGLRCHHAVVEARMRAWLERVRGRGGGP